MKKIKASLNKVHMIFCELVLRQGSAVDRSFVEYEKTIEDIRMKSYEIRRFYF